MTLKRLTVFLGLLSVLFWLVACQPSTETPEETVPTESELSVLEIINTHLEKDYYALDIMYQLDAASNKSINRRERLVFFKDDFLKAYILDDSKAIMYRYTEQGGKPYFIYKEGSTFIQSLGLTSVRKVWSFNHIIFDIMKDATFTKTENQMNYYNLTYFVNEFDETNNHLLSWIDNTFGQVDPVNGDFSQIEIRFEMHTTLNGELVSITIDALDYMREKFPMKTGGFLDIPYYSAGIMFIFTDETYTKDVTPLTSFVIDDYPNYLIDPLPLFILNEPMIINHEYERDADIFQLIITDQTTLTLSNPDGVTSIISIYQPDIGFYVTLREASITLEPGTYILAVNELMQLGTQNILITTS